MKKLVILFFVIISYVSVSYSQIFAGGGLSFGSERYFGLNLRGMYSLNENFDIQSGVDIFQVRKSTIVFSPYVYDMETSSVNLSFNGHYNLRDMVDDFVFYPVFGLDIIFTRTVINDIPDGQVFTGVNVGVGGSYEFMTDLHAFFETKYILSQDDQLVISTGVVYRFDISKDEEED